MDADNTRNQYLSKAQCEQIWRTLDSYPCT
jgi:hypothetical protein